MRPTKLGTHVIEAFRQVLADDDNVLCGTDDDLFFLLNENLAPEDQISYRSFQRYKALALQYGMDDVYLHTDDDSQSDYFSPVYQQLYKLFRHALLRQKKVLMRNMLTDDKCWRRWQWILERKFREWNLRYSNIEAERIQKRSAKEEEEIEDDEQPEGVDFRQPFNPPKYYQNQEPVDDYGDVKHPGGVMKSESEERDQEDEDGSEERERGAT
jgi:hypothetical protein